MSIKLNKDPRYTVFYLRGSRESFVACQHKAEYQFGVAITRVDSFIKMGVPSRCRRVGEPNPYKSSSDFATPEEAAEYYDGVVSLMIR